MRPRNKGLVQDIQGLVDDAKGRDQIERIWDMTSYNRPFKSAPITRGTRNLRLSKSQLTRRGLLRTDKARLAGVTHAALEPLRELNRAYMDILAADFLPIQSRADRVSHGELVGAELEVVKCGIMGLATRSGTVAAETERTITLVTVDDEVLTIPKRVSVFGLRCGDGRYIIHGLNYCHRPGQRSKMKLKGRYSVRPQDHKSRFKEDAMK